MSKTSLNRQSIRYFVIPRKILYRIKGRNPCGMRALKKSDSLLKELGFFYEKWYNENERRGIEHAER